MQRHPYEKLQHLQKNCLIRRIIQQEKCPHLTHRQYHHSPPLNHDLLHRGPHSIKTSHDNRHHPPQRPLIIENPPTTILKLFKNNIDTINEITSKKAII
jgi:hypothetical protein